MANDVTKTKDICCKSGSFVFLLMSFLGFIVAFSSTYWIIDGATHYGLWKVCTGYMCASLVGNQLTTAAFVSAQLLFCTSLVLCVLAVGGHIAGLIQNTELTGVITWTGQLSAAFCAGVGVILWGNETYRYFGDNMLSWSYWLMICSVLVMALSAGITACKTGCATRLHRDRAIVYSSTRAARGAANAAETFLSQSSELETSRDNTMTSAKRPHRGWRDGDVGNYRY